MGTSTVGILLQFADFFLTLDSCLQSLVSCLSLLDEVVLCCLSAVLTEGLLPCSFVCLDGYCCSVQISRQYRASVDKIGHLDGDILFHHHVTLLSSVDGMMNILPSWWCAPDERFLSLCVCSAGFHVPSCYLTQDNHAGLHRVCVAVILA